MRLVRYRLAGSVGAFLMAGTLVCDGAVSASVEGFPTCSVAWLVQPAPEPYDVTLIDPALVGDAFAVGFALVAGVWLIGYPIRLVLSMFK